MTLPPLDPTFHWTAEAWGYALRCKPLSAIAQHAFTTRQLALRGGPQEQPVGWTQATAAVGGGLEQLLRVRQVHGAAVRVLRAGATGAREIGEKPDADAIVSDASGLVLSVQVADCVPVLIADAKTGAAAAIHAGWRGTCAGIAGGTVTTMVRELGAHADDMIAAIGPSIGPCCYTVGHNVLESFRKSGFRDAALDQWFRRGAGGTLQLDLWAANRDQLCAAGVSADRIHLSGLCTKTYHDIFESYRVDGERAGRMAALIAVP